MSIRERALEVLDFLEVLLAVVIIGAAVLLGVVDPLDPDRTD